MKKIFIYMSVAIVAIACTKSDSDATANKHLSATPSTIYASFEGQTRTELQWESGEPKTYWSVGDKILIYDDTPNHHAYLLNENTPTRKGSFTRDENSTVAGAPPVEHFNIDKTVAFYPYPKIDNGVNLLNYEDKPHFQYFIPSTQTFAGSNTYGSDANFMVAVEDKGSSNFSFNNLLGYLKVTLKGSATISSIELMGNNNEILAGIMMASLDNYLNAGIASNIADDSYTLTLDCGEGVELNSDEGISFIFALPPQTFEDGFTITATTTDGRTGKISTSNEIIIKRNKITPMASILFTPLMGNKNAAEAVKGDLALLDGSFISIADITDWTNQQKANIAGIVFWTTKDTDLTDDTRETPAKLSDDKIMSADYPSCNHGLIVALSNISSYSNWSDDNTDNAVADWQTSTFDATDKGNYLAINGPINFISGYQKTKLLKAYNKYCTDNSQGGKIVTPVSSLESWNVQAPANTTGWYIPSPKELHMLCCKDVDNIFYAHNNGVTPETRTLIDGLLSSLGATTLGEYAYWSSMEASIVDGENMYDAIRVHFSNGAPHGYRKDFGINGQYYGYVRAICAF